MEIPTVLIAYNRPKHIQQVIESLRPHRPNPLFVFCDGPKTEKDIGAVMEVRAIVQRIDWTNPLIIARNNNIGLSRSITTAVDYVLGLYKTVILLEDDCVVGPYFFAFITSCLEKYRNVGRVMGVTGYTVPIPEIIRITSPYDAYFIPRPGSWGWATWRDRWQLYEWDLTLGLARAQEDGVNLTAGGDDVPRLIEQTIRGHLDAWTPGWMLAVARHGLFIYPTVSHIRNIGFDGTGIHCARDNRYDTPMAMKPSTRLPDEPIVDARLLANFKGFYR